ncbi:HAD family hydrolase [Motilimonas cestriensis]|uniref:HAD family hydrolase n=1 Tax=Motilimonas cestriensis TaxID=2742685 RepID=UPI003DA5605B
MTQPLYVFDLDDTLINGDCAMIWSEFLADNGIATDPDFVANDRALMSQYANGTLDMAQYLEFVMVPLKDVPVAQVHQLAERCVQEKVLPKLYPEAQRLIENLHRDNIATLIISASVDFIVQAVAHEIGISQAMGIELKVVNQRYTHEIQGIPSFREGKVTRIKEWLANRPEHHGEVHFFTDSINDLPLCEYADQTYLVNPCQQLTEHARRTQWPILNWGNI